MMRLSWWPLTSGWILNLNKRKKAAKFRTWLKSAFFLMTSRLNTCGWRLEKEVEANYWRFSVMQVKEWASLRCRAAEEPISCPKAGTILVLKVLQFRGFIYANPRLSSHFQCDEITSQQVICSDNLLLQSWAEIRPDISDSGDISMFQQHRGIQKSIIYMFQGRDFQRGSNDVSRSSFASHWGWALRSYQSHTFALFSVTYNLADFIWRAADSRGRQYLKWTHLAAVTSHHRIPLKSRNFDYASISPSCEPTLYPLTVILDTNSKSISPKISLSRISRLHVTYCHGLSDSWKVSAGVILSRWVTEWHPCGAFRETRWQLRLSIVGVCGRLCGIMELSSASSSAASRQQLIKHRHFFKHRQGMSNVQSEIRCG